MSNNTVRKKLEMLEQFAMNLNLIVAYMKLHHPNLNVKTGITDTGEFFVTYEYKELVQ